MRRHGVSGRALFLLPGLLVMAAEEGMAVRSYALPGHGTLELTVPSSWQDSISHPHGDLPPTIEYSPGAGDSFSVQITPLWSPTGDPNFNRLEVIRPLIETIGRKQLEQSVETAITLKEVKGAEASGYAFTVTDRAPKEEEWRYLTAGAVGVGDLLLSFTILTNNLDSGELQQALSMIETTRQKSAPAPGSTPALADTPAPTSLRKLTYPGKKWSLVLDLPGFEFEERQTYPGMTGVRVFGNNQSTGVIISVFLERADHEGDARACREFYRKKGRGKGLPEKDVHYSERRNMALIEYTFGKIKGIDINHRNVNAYLSNDGVWIDIHISKPEVRPEDQKLFEAILDSVRILGASASPAGGSSAPADAPRFTSRQSLPAPSRGWALALDTLGATLTGSLQYAFDEEEGQVVAQRVVGSMWEGGSEKTGMLFHVTIGQAARDGDAKACREYFWRPARSMPIGKKTDLRIYERDDLALVEFMLPRMEGHRVDAKNLLAFLSHDGIWIAIHLTKIDFKPEDQSLFDTVLKSIRVGDLATTGH